MNIARASPLEEWQKQIISFTAQEVPEPGEQHDNPLVVRLEINPKQIEEEDEEKDDENEDSWAINRVLIDTGISVDILRTIVKIIFECFLKSLENS